jgi:hypothetical protein
MGFTKCIVPTQSEEIMLFTITPVVALLLHLCDPALSRDDIHDASWSDTCSIDPALCRLLTLYEDQFLTFVFFEYRVSPAGIELDVVSIFAVPEIVVGTACFECRCLITGKKQQCREKNKSEITSHP